jgi:hypothetical protein
MIGTMEAGLALVPAAAWELTVFAAIAIFAPSLAALRTIDNPIPLDAPLMNIVFPFKSPIFLN